MIASTDATSLGRAATVAAAVALGFDCAVACDTGNTVRLASRTLTTLFMTASQLERDVKGSNQPLPRSKAPPGSLRLRRLPPRLDHSPNQYEPNIRARRVGLQP